MKVKRIEIKNFKAIDHAQVDLNGSHIIVMGKNGVGKSTLGRLVQDLLTRNTPLKPVKEGEKQGYCKVELTDGSVIHYTFDEQNQKLNIISDKEATLAQFCKKLAGKGMSFDIDAFLKMPPKPRKELLLQIAGIDLSYIEQRYNKAYNERAEANMRLKTQQSRIKPYDIELEGKEKIDVIKLSKQYNDALAHNLNYNLNYEKAEILDREIAEMKKKLTALESERLFIQQYLNTHTLITENAIIELQKQINEAESINTKIEEANRLAKEFGLAEKYEQEASFAHELVKQIEAEKEEILSKADLPAGIKFSSEGLEIDGLPFESNQISSSRKMIAALEIAEKMLGDVRYLHFDASMLDKENAEKILNWANEKDLQLCLERALWDGTELTYEIIEPKSL